MVKKSCLRIVGLLLGLLVGTNLNAQTKEKRNLVLGGFVHSGTIFVHTPQVENTRGAKPKGIEFEWTHQNSDSNTYNKWGFFTRSGYTFSYFDFGTKILGQSFSSGYFIEPIFRLNRYVDVRIKATAGFSYLTNPGTEDSTSTRFDTSNHTYSGYINAFLQLGVGVGVRISPTFTLQLKGSFNHNSNGGFTKPNRGINFPTASVGLLYHPGGNTLPKLKRLKSKDWKLKQPELHAGLFFSPKEGWNKTYQRKLLLGANLQVSKYVSPNSRLTIIGEVYHDGGIAFTKKGGYIYKDSSTGNTSVITDASNSWFVNAGIGHELVISKFTFFQHFGFHLYKNVSLYNKYYRQGMGEIGSTYQRYGLMMDVAKHWRVGFSLLSRGNVADYIDLRCLFKIKAHSK